MTVPPQHPSAGQPDPAVPPGPPPSADPPAPPDTAAPSDDPAQSANPAQFDSPASPDNPAPSANPTLPDDPAGSVTSDGTDPAAAGSLVPPASATPAPPGTAFPVGQPAATPPPPHHVPPGQPSPGGTPNAGYGPPAMPPLSDTQQFPAMAPYPPGPGQPPGFAEPPVPGGPPAAPYPGQAPGARRSRAAVILAITTALFFVLSATMTGLYLSKSAELDAANSDIRDLRKSLDASQKALKRNKAELKDSRTANRVLSECVEDVTRVFDALDRTGEASASLVSDAKSACDRAERYLE